MGQPVVHFEVMGRDIEQIRGFYSGMFGWSINTDNPMGYGLVDREANLSREGVGIGGGVGQAPEGYAGHVTFYVAVPDVEAALQQAESARRLAHDGPRAGHGRSRDRALHRPRGPRGRPHERRLTSNSTVPGTGYSAEGWSSGTAASLQPARSTATSDGRSDRLGGAVGPGPAAGVARGRPQEQLRRRARGTGRPRRARTRRREAAANAAACVRFLRPGGSSRSECSWASIASAPAWPGCSPAQIAAEAVVVLPAAQRARAVPGGERRRLVEEEELGEPARLHHRPALPAPELEPAGDPALHLEVAANASVRVVQAAAVAVDQAAGRGGDQLAARRDPVLERHRAQPPSMRPARPT